MAVRVWDLHSGHRKPSRWDALMGRSVDKHTATLGTAGQTLGPQVEDILGASVRLETFLHPSEGFAESL